MLLTLAGCSVSRSASSPPHACSRGTVGACHKATRDATAARRGSLSDPSWLLYLNTDVGRTCVTRSPTPGLPGQGTEESIQLLSRQIKPDGVELIYRFNAFTYPKSKSLVPAQHFVQKYEVLTSGDLEIPPQSENHSGVLYRLYRATVFPPADQLDKRASLVSKINMALIATTPTARNALGLTATHDSLTFHGSLRVVGLPITSAVTASGPLHVVALREIPIAGETGLSGPLTLYFARGIGPLSAVAALKQVYVACWQAGGS